MERRKYTTGKDWGLFAGSKTLNYARAQLQIAPENRMKEYKTWIFSQMAFSHFKLRTIRAKVCCPSEL
jgi:hypothetical protein